MNETELGDALLRGEEPIDIAALTQRVLRRDRRRIWILGILCVIAWMGVVMLPWATIMPMMAKVVQHQMEVNSTAPTTAQAQTRELLQIVKVGTMATFAGSVGSMFVAAICTVLLIVFSRRATLRQLNARLSEISAQLKSLSGSK